MIEATTGVGRRRRGWRLLVWSLAGIAALVLAGFLAVPPIVKQVLEQRLSDELARAVTVEHVRFNPFRLQATIDGIAIRERGAETTLLTVRQLAADISLASVWRRAPVLDGLRLDGPELNLVREADGRYNIQDLIDRVVSAPPGPTPEFSLNNIEVMDGKLRFDDRPAGVRHAVDGLRVGIPFLSSLPHDVEIRVRPELAATIDGRSFALTGQLQPFAEPPQATLDVDIDALPLPRYLAYLPWPPRLRLASGALTTRLKVSFVAGDAQSRALSVAGDATVKDPALTTTAGEALVSMSALTAKIGKLDIFARALEVTELRVAGPVVDLRRAADGSFEWRDLLPATPPAPAAEASVPPWRWRVATAQVSGGALRLVDGSTKPVFRSTVRDLEVKAERISGQPGERGQVALSFSTDLGAAVSADVAVALSPVAAEGRVSAKGLNLKRLYPYYAPLLNLEVGDGVLEAATAFAVSIESNGQALVRTTEGVAEIADLRLLLPGEKEPLWRVPNLVAKGITVDSATRRVALAELSVNAAVGRIQRDADGVLNFARVLRTGSGDPRGAAAAEDWQFAIERATYERGALAFDDRVPATPFHARASDIRLVATGLSTAPGKAARLEARARIGNAGRLAVKGPLAARPFRGRLEVDAAGIELAPWQSYLEGYANVVVTAGTAAARGVLDIGAGTAAADTPAIGWKGEVTLSDFVSFDKPTMSDLARWKRLALTEVDATSTPARLRIGQVAADSFFARVILHDDATLNLQRLLRPPGEVPAPAVPAVAAAPVTAEPVPPPVAIDRIVLTDGSVEFFDYFVKPNYSARLTNVSGSVSAMSRTTTGDVDIVARLERLAPVEIRGRLNPFARDLVLDLTGKARDIELSPLSPYAVKYAGYGIEKGKLAFDVHYAIEGRKLAASNRVVLDQLTFGERVESPTATKLPVLLAVALLKDARGVIDINLPIEGSLDDPKFSVGGLIVQVIVNLLTKAITAPFALISAALGGGAEMAWLEFDPGSAALNAAAEAKAGTLAKALVDRPGLKVEITGRADAASDAAGLRRAAVERAIRVQKAKATAAGGDGQVSAEDVVVAADERNRYLTAAYREAPIADRPRNFIGMLKEVPPAEMEAMLERHAGADAEALRELAQRRAQAVKDWMAGTGGIAAERLFLVAPRADGDARKDGAGPRRVDFALK